MEFFVILETLEDVVAGYLAHCATIHGIIEIERSLLKARGFEPLCKLSLQLFKDLWNKLCILV